MLRTPAQRLGFALAYCLLAAAVAVATAGSMPWLGLQLRPTADGGVEIASASGPATGLPAGARVLAIAAVSGEPRVALEARDLMEEPDLLPDYDTLDAFFGRQQRLSEILAQPQVGIVWEQRDGVTSTTAVSPRARPVGTLPALFWFQIAVAVGGCLIASWVWALRPDPPGVRMFWITGMLCPAFAMPAAIYSTRELAIDGGLFRALSAMNHFSSAVWGAALVAILMSHPKPLARTSRLSWPFLFFGAWCLAGLARLLPDLDLGIRIPLMVEMVLALGLGVAQWRLSRNAPTDRAALRWLLLSLLVGSALFILTVVASTSLGWMPALPQGYAFGFFLFVYAGIALGLRRYRLFELDAWALRMLLWIGGAVAVLAVDALLVTAVGLSQAPALGAAVWICGLLYLPARQWLWQRLSGGAPVALQDLVPEAVRIALEPSAHGRMHLWDALLARLCDPLELSACDPRGPDRTVLEEEGLAMRVPACAGVPARRLRYPRRGGRLFSPKEAALVEGLRALVDQAHGARDAQERGARHERRRIARDVHDDVGARLLMLMHRAPSPEHADLARAAMRDLRTALASLDPTPVPLSDAVADWRVEASQRCEAAGVALAWRSDAAQSTRELSAGAKSLAERLLRECLTNALRHSRPGRVEIEVGAHDDALSLRVRNDGAPAGPEGWKEGRGLSGMRQRVAEHGGSLAVASSAAGTVEVSARIPFAPTEVR